jgi:hypothetical protein
MHSPSTFPFLFETGTISGIVGFVDLEPITGSFCWLVGDLDQS